MIIRTMIFIIKYYDDKDNNDDVDNNNDYDDGDNDNHKDGN